MVDLKLILTGAYTAGLNTTSVKSGKLAPGDEMVKVVEKLITPTEGFAPLIISWAFAPKITGVLRKSKLLSARS